MSWGARYVLNNDVIEEDSFSLNNVIGNFEHEEQYNKAAELAYQLISSGAIGDPLGRYGVNLSGHGNPGHEPQPKWANDHVSIQVVQHIQDEV